MRYRRIVGLVVAVSQSPLGLDVTLRYQATGFLRSRTVEETFWAQGSIANALPHWIHVGGTFDFQIEEGTNQIIGISVVS